MGSPSSPPAISEVSLSIYYYTPVLKQTTNTEPVSGVQYSCESRPPLTLPGTLSCTGGTQNRKSAERTVLIANFRVFSPYFRVNSVDKSYRKAIINYLRESNTKIGENRRESAWFRCFRFKCQHGQYGLVRPAFLTS